MLQEIQEMGSHAKDIYDFLLSGLGRFSFFFLFSTLRKYKLVFVCLNTFPLSRSRSTDHRLSSDAESHNHDDNTAGLPVLCTVPRTSLNGQSQTFPAQGTYDSLQLLACGLVNIHRI